MSWFADLLSRTHARRTFRAAPSHGSLLIVVALAIVAMHAFALAGCGSEPRCSLEVCDGRDNDCDHRSDEGFVDAHGRYTSAEHCGGCGVDCASVFPSAAVTECVVEQDVPACRITACPTGHVLAGDGACVREPPVLCLACSSDAECEQRSAGARCLTEPTGGGRCGRACARESDCPTGYACTQTGAASAQCRPVTGSCLCSETLNGVSFACELRTSDDHVCTGTQLCDGDELSACEPAVTESCNAFDDDCDGATDEDFVDELGRYTSTEHCGGCGKACVAPGVHMQAQCLASGESGRCDSRCEDGFVDVDGLVATGCECELAQGPVIVVGGDSDCDGTIDPTPALIFVSPSGDDQNSGVSPSSAVRTLPRGLALGLVSGRSVLVARGIYQGPVSLLPGVTLIGGYSPDFRERDVELYPVLIEAPSSDGRAVLRCTDIDSPTYVDGFTIVASDTLQASTGNTAVWLDGCTSKVTLAELTVLAGRGGEGEPGQDAGERVAEVGASSLTELVGVAGGVGVLGGQVGSGCPALPGGAGGTKSCGSSAVSGGHGGGAQCAALSCDNQSSAACGNAGCTDFTQNGVCDIEAAKQVAIANPAPGEGQGAQHGAAAEATYDAPTNHDVCHFCDDNPSLPRIGGDGGDGGSGADGSGGAACTLANNRLDADGRMRAGEGQDGTRGQDGSGGGGGSAGAGYAVIANTQGSCTSVSGGSGGGGGSGGCGAPGAGGGGGGGASVGVLIRLSAGASAGPQLPGLRVVTASGGDGGDGGSGASGGPGGTGGLGGVSQFWCARGGGRGGDGGSGGDGGGGGGGCGGNSYGVFVLAGQGGSAYVDGLGAAAQIELAGVAGGGGRAGFSPGSTGGAGLSGQSAAIGAGQSAP